MGRLILSIVAIVFFAWCFLWACIGSSANLNYVKDRAEGVWTEQGFDVVAYEGYQWGSGGWGTRYGGARVWYRLRKPGNNITYSGFLRRWGDEIHVYGPTAVDAIAPNQD